MPATPQRISFIVQEYRSAINADPSIKDRYGPIARDTGDAPVPTYFDSMTDVQAMLDERFALLKGDRRKFTVAIAGVMSFTGALDFSQVTPTIRIVDTEKAAAFNGALTGIQSVDYETNRTTLTVWG